MCVVVDFDGVLFDLNSRVEERIHCAGYPDFSFNNIVTYDLNKSVDNSLLSESIRGLQCNGLGCPRDLILKFYGEIESFYNAPLYHNAYEGLFKLTDKYKVIINTQCFTKEVARFKVGFFDSYFKDLDLSYNICIGDTKPSISGAYAVIDDSIQNFVGYSSDTCKVLIDKTYNRSIYNSGLISGLENMYRAESFLHGVKYLLEEV